MAIGLAVATLYVALAMFSGQLSPIARRPALDGLGPLTPYRWVSPPPEVTDNEAPSSLALDLEVEGGRTAAEAAFTPDDQVTVYLGRGAIETEAARVRLDVTPLDPAALGSLPGGLSPFGNAIEVRAAQEPGGDPVERFRDVLVYMVYPETTSLHALEHDLLFSADGRTWERLDTEESVVQSLVSGEVSGPGYLVVGGVPKVLTSPRPPGVGTEGAGILATILLVVSVTSLLLGVGMLLRARRTPRSERD